MFLIRLSFIDTLMDTYTFDFCTLFHFSVDNSGQYLYFSLFLVYIALLKSLFRKDAWLPQGYPGYLNEVTLVTLTSFVFKGAYFSIVSKKY